MPPELFSQQFDLVKWLVARCRWVSACSAVGMQQGVSRQCEEYRRLQSDEEVFEGVLLRNADSADSGVKGTRQIDPLAY